MKFLVKSNILIILINILFLVSCSDDKSKNPKEKILVNIDNKVTISLNEFIRRAEYTVRPKYCKQNSYLHKKIILNSLVAEKLFALEVENNPKIVENDNFQGYLKGRREQAMRQYMYFTEATQKVKLDSSEVKNIYSRANREFEVEYYNINDQKVIAALNKSDTLTQQNFNDVFNQLSLCEEKILTRKIKFGSQESSKIINALYSSNLKKGQVLKPIKIGNNDFLMVRVKGWEDSKSITENQIKRRLEKVTETLTHFESSKIWKNEVKKIMKGKSLVFNAEVAKKVSDLFKEKFFKTDDQKKELLKAKFYDQEIKVKQILDKAIRKDFLNQPFFELDGKVWTVKDFKNEVVSHPLVFRNRRIPAGAFAKEFKNAIVDLIEDYFITKKAYSKGYNKVNIIQRNEKMWKDSFLATFQKNNYLKTVGENRSFGKNYLEIIEKYLNPYVKNLQKKYYKKIELDFDEFEKINLTSIDLYVKQPSQPYKIVVPMFPVFTTENNLEYIKKMN